jgi:hypothetical protein
VKVKITEKLSRDFQFENFDLFFLLPAAKVKKSSTLVNKKCITALKILGNNQIYK